MLRHLYLCFVAEILHFMLASGATTTLLTLPTTVPPSTTRAPPAMLFRFGSSLHRQDVMLDVKPVRVIKDVSRPQCLSLCIRHQGGETTCKAFNYGKKTCFLLNTYVCDGERVLTAAPGFSYFDLVTNYDAEIGFMKTKQCQNKGKCSNKCRKFRLNKTPSSWHEAYSACREEEAQLAMPKTLREHETMVAMLKANNLLQCWIGLGKKNGQFYYTDGTPLNSTFTMWGPDQPNDSGGTQQCVQMMSEMDYMWNDFDCSRPVGFICQYVW